MSKTISDEVVIKIVGELCKAGKLKPFVTRDYAQVGDLPKAYYAYFNIFEEIIRIEHEFSDNHPDSECESNLRVLYDESEAFEDIVLLNTIYRRERLDVEEGN